MLNNVSVVVRLRAASRFCVMSAMGFAGALGVSGPVPAIASSAGLAFLPAPCATCEAAPITGRDLSIDVGGRSAAVLVQPIPSVSAGPIGGLVVETHLYLNFAPAWLKLLGRSAERAEGSRGTGHYDVGAIHRRPDSGPYELTLFYVDTGLDSVRQQLEMSCASNGGKIDQKALPDGKQQIVYCLAST